LSDHGTALEEGYWWFATDAPYLAKTGATVVGFGPGEEELAHTTRESVCVRELALAREGYAALVRRFTQGGQDAA
jgi:acetylornithine deacetylase/succinyl-diaminopimelate desuccinylase-like protein